MRTKEEIEKLFGEIWTEDSAFDRLHMELLLDIRELLKGMREQTLYEAVSEARQEEESRRREQVRERLKPAGGD